MQITDSDLAVQYEPAGLTFVKNRIGCPKKAIDQIGFKARLKLEDGLLLCVVRFDLMIYFFWYGTYFNDVDFKRGCLEG